jgi:regulator of protease activity HflC (stomatin/prohibitin superfamily)
MKTDTLTARFTIFVVLAVLAAIPLGMWGMPQYRVYEQRMAGAATLAESESSRQVLIQEAHAKMESAKMLAQAEVERAKGVAEANKIIGSSLKDNDEYLRYLWIHNLEAGNNAVIYVPTEAGLPILEAGKRELPK